eukprot:g1481.t1
MEEELKEALKKYEENLILFPAKPEDDKTAQAKAEIEEAIETIQELLMELENSTETEDTVMESADQNNHGYSTMDFADPVATLQLTKTLLKEYYDITWDIPVGHLVPPLPCRAKYNAWIHDLLQLSSPDRNSVRGLDIGCGANCIYPLLGAATYGWNFIGTDITAEAVLHANANRDRNPRIGHLINIIKIPESCQDILIPVVQEYGDFHFSMCNPPFFSSIEEASQNQKTAFGGTMEEMVHPGGELAFVNKILQESIQLQAHIHWYTVMLGKKTTFKQIRAQLHSLGAVAIRTSTLLQGKITRWTIAWSFAAKNTNDKPLRQISTSSSLIYQLPSLGRVSSELIKCLSKTIQAHGGTAMVQSETKLAFQFPGGKQENLSLEALPEGPDNLTVLFSEKTPIPHDVFQKVWDDVKILWNSTEYCT